MRKVNFILSLLVVFLLTPMSFALTLDIDRVSGYYSGSGGEFSIKSLDLLWVLANYDSETKGKWGTNSFQSFCLEHNEYVSPPGNYDFTISDKAIAGGVGPVGDPISKGTAWLYAQFVKGTLAGYEYTPGAGRAADAKALQETIWWLEDEIGDPGVGNEFRNLVLGVFGTEAAAKVDFTGDYIKVLNLWVTGHPGEYSYRKQDQLVYVPEPGILILLGIGLSAVGLVARRYKKI